MSEPLPAAAATLCAHGLLLRPWSEDGAADETAALRIALGDPEMGRWNPVAVHKEPGDTEVRRWLAVRAKGWACGTRASWCVRDEATGAVLGNVSLQDVDRRRRRGLVGYWTLPGARGGRVASRALAAVTRWAFAELALHRLELGHAMGHDASCRIAVRCGYPLEGILREALSNGAGDLLDMHLHARLSTDPPCDPLGR
ncbi:GNAT family N-acetyltransferase [Peterkaempfera griseoplana]|uniref:GNAT family N-acetyltransferase n=1 Tax=Peterkaempfera griseoplana TaxID=66896 RepID=UPI0006E13484|nr:GNAT family N-acetyltransferase [Peterkaempfera griseoplana]